MSTSGEPVAPYAGTLAVAMTLAGVAGCLDAVSLARITGTFVAFQTGNTVLVGLGLGQGQLVHAGPPAAAVVAYLVGSTLAPVVVRGVTRPIVAVRRLLAVATALLFVEVLLVVLGAGLDAPHPTGRLRYACIVVSAMAMAFQTPAVRRVRGVPVASTFSSGMMTRLGQALGSLRDPATRSRELQVVRVLGGTILAFVAGATLGALLLDPFGNAAVVVPAVGLVAVGVMLVRTRPAPSAWSG